MLPPRPRLSVVMPVRNAACFVDAAAGSILSQSFGDLEFVALDDASTDGSGDRLAAWAAQDARLRVFRSETPLGLVGSSNAAVRASRAPLVARMDADDVSDPERLARQVAVMERDPGVELVGTAFDGIDAEGRTVRPRDRWRLLRPSPFAPFPHGSIVFRRATFDEVGGYRPGAEYWEDLDLFHRLAARGRVVVLPERLYHYRYHRTNVRNGDQDQQVLRAMRRMRQALGLACGALGAGSPPVAELDEGCDDDAELLYSLCATQIWAGHDPRLWPRLRWSMLSAASPRVAAIFGVAAVASMSPCAARLALASVVAARDRVAGWRVGEEPREWRFVS